MIATSQYSYLNIASRKLAIAGHMLYVTFPLIKDSRLLIKILNELHLSTLNLINAVLEHEYSHKRVQLYRDKNLNFNTFRNKSAPRLGISAEQLAGIQEIFYIMERHKQSPLEFVRQDKFVIMSDDMDTSILNLEKLKDYVNLISDILKKARNMMESENSLAE